MKHWSKLYMKTLLEMGGYKQGPIKQWTDDEWNEAGDYLYYKVRKHEKDSVKNRAEPAHLKKLRK